MKTLYIHGSADHYGSAKILLDILRIPGNAEEAVVILPHDGLLVKDLQTMNIPVHILNLGVLRRKYFTPWGIIGRIFLWIRAIVKLKGIIRKSEIGRVYSNSANVIIGPFLKKKNKTELVWHIHEIVEKPAILRSLLCFLFKKADRLITVSKATQSFWSDHCKMNRFQLLYNGIDSKRFEFAEPNRKRYCPIATETDIIVGMIGRIQPWKGQHYFLDIMHAFYQMHPSSAERVFVCMAGDPYPGYEYLTEELIDKIKEKELEEKVFYNGYINNTPEWMASIDILVLPSLQPDPLPTVVLEAMSAGKPVLATAQGGALEMIEEKKTGFFIPLNDSTSSATILSSMIEDASGRKEMEINAKERVARLFSAERFADDWRRLLNS